MKVRGKRGADALARLNKSTVLNMFLVLSTLRTQLWFEDGTVLSVRANGATGWQNST